MLDQIFNLILLQLIITLFIWLFLKSGDDLIELQKLVIMIFEVKT